MSDKKIMYESDDAAVFEKRELEGWWSVDPITNKTYFYDKNDESFARYNGSTHKKCECGNVHSKSYTACKECRYKNRLKTYLNYELVEWDETTPLCCFDSDDWFYSEEDIQNYCDDNSCSRGDLLLVLCEPQTLREVDTDYWCDDLAEDGELPGSVLEAIDELNDVLTAAGTVSWVPGNKRII